MSEPTRTGPLSVPAMLLAVALPLACENPPGYEPDGSDGSDGSGELVGYTLADSASLSVGGHDDRPTHQFQFTLGAVRLSDGGIVVADAGPREIRYYGDDGDHLQTAGGEGEGPGEFRTLRSVAWNEGDTIVAWDSGGHAVSFFTADGTLASGSTVGDWLSVREELAARTPGILVALPQVHSLRADGTIIGEPLYERVPGAMDETRVIQDTVPLVVFDREGGSVASLGPFPATESFFDERAGMALRFGDRLEVTAGSELVFVGSRRDPVIRGLEPTGDTIVSFTLPLEPRPLDPDEVPPPDITGPAAEFVEAMPLPDSMPLYSDLRYGRDGLLWVQKYVAPNDDAQRWLAFEKHAGEPIASLEMNASLEVMEIGSDYAIVLSTDELDVEEVRLHELVEG